MEKDMKMFGRSLCATILLVSLAGCATSPMAHPGTAMGESEIRHGTISRIDAVLIDTGEKWGVGAIIGGVAGGLIGHQIGNGHGRTVATVASTLLGGYAGHQVQSHGQTQAGQHVFVRLDSGVTVGITQPADPSLRVGDAVRIDGSGPTARLTRR